MSLPNYEKLAISIVLLLFLMWTLAPYFHGPATPNPIFLSLGPLDIRWYGVLMALGVALGYFMIHKYRGRVVTEAHLDHIFFLVVILGIIGARLTFVILKWPEFQANPLEALNITQGGLSIHGALIGGFVGIIFAVRKFKLELRRILDLLILAVPLGQAIGRFGNFFNSEAFGGPTNLPWKMYVAPAFRPPEFITATHFHPTFLYEAIGSALIFLFLLHHYPKSQIPGQIFAWYLILYSSLRFIVEFFRVDSDSILYLTIAQWLSLVLIVVGIVLLRKTWKSLS